MNHNFASQIDRDFAPPLEKPKSKNQREFMFSCLVADLLRRCACPDVLWTHFPAGEHRSEKTGERLKRMGLQRGWPDYIFLIPGSPTSFLELKIVPEGKRVDNLLGEHQRAFRDRALAMQLRWAVATNLEEVVQRLSSWGALKPGVRVSA